MIHAPDPKAKHVIRVRLAKIDRNDEWKENSRRMIIRFLEPGDWKKKGPSTEIFSSEVLLYIGQKGRSSVVFYEDKIWSVTIRRKYRTSWFSAKAIKIDITPVEIPEAHYKRLHAQVVECTSRWL